MKTCSETNLHLRREKETCELMPPLPTHTHPFHRLFELLNKNSGLCIKLQFGETKLSEGIIILISKKKIKPLQIFLDYSTLGDLSPPHLLYQAQL